MVSAVLHETTPPACHAPTDAEVQLSVETPAAVVPRSKALREAGGARRSGEGSKVLQLHTPATALQGSPAAAAAAPAVELLDVESPEPAMRISKKRPVAVTPEAEAASLEASAGPPAAAEQAPASTAYAAEASAAAAAAAEASSAVAAAVAAEPRLKKARAAVAPASTPASSLEPKRAAAASSSTAPAAKSSCETEIRDHLIGDGLRVPGTLWRALHPHQRDGVQWLWKRHREKGGAILADEMGLGKTAQILVYLAAIHHSGVLHKMRVINTSHETSRCAKPGGILVICPATLVAQWRAEFAAWYPSLPVTTLHGPSDEQGRVEAIWGACAEQKVLLTTYETMRAKCDDILDANWVVAILDEGQRIRSPDADATIAVKKLSTPHRILLTGCPIQNNLQELWSLIDFVTPGLLGTLPVFLTELGHPIEMGSLATSNPAQAATAYQCARALRNLTANCILRRQKADIMEELKIPGKKEQVLFCNPTAEQYVAYLECLQSRCGLHAVKARRDGRPTNSLALCQLLRKLCNHPDLVSSPSTWNAGFGELSRSGKAKVLVDLVDTWKKQGHRVLIFVQHQYIMDLVSRWFDSKGHFYFQVHGKTPVGERLNLVKQFNADKRIFAMVLTNRIGGVGLNIVGANRVVLFDPDWNPMTSVRARERVWRIGQQKDVEIYRLILAGTIEEKIYRRTVNKQVLSQKILNDPKQQLVMHHRDLSDLFAAPMKPPSVDDKRMLKLRAKYKAFFDNVVLADDDEDEHSNAASAGILYSGGSTDCPACLKHLYDSRGLKSSFDQSEVEKGNMSRTISEGSSMIAVKAVEALKKSMRERASHDISTPTWTGKRGRAGASLAQMRASSGSSGGGVGEAAPKGGRGAGKLVCEEGELSKSVAEAMKKFLANRGKFAAQGATPVQQLSKAEQEIAAVILRAFLNPALSGEEHILSTGGVLEHVAPGVPALQKDRLKKLLNEVCVFRKPQDRSPGVWTLREAYWPLKNNGPARLKS